MTLITILLFTTLQVFAPERREMFIQGSEAIFQPEIKDVYRLLKKYQIKNPDIVLCQARLETGHLRSLVLKSNKNLFGMRYAPQRKTTAIGERFGCAVYLTIEESIKDYRIWQDLYYRGEDYYEFLQRIGYAEDKLYIEKLKQIKKYL